MKQTFGPRVVSGGVRQLGSLFTHGLALVVVACTVLILHILSAVFHSLTHINMREFLTDQVKPSCFDINSIKYRDQPMRNTAPEDSVILIFKYMNLSPNKSDR
jgi:hypothetical protein